MWIKGRLVRVVEQLVNDAVDAAREAGYQAYWKGNTPNPFTAGVLHDAWCDGFETALDDHLYPEDDELESAMQRREDDLDEFLSDELRRIDARVKAEGAQWLELEQTLRHLLRKRSG